MLPLSLFRDMSSLSSTSCLSISADVIIVIIVCVKSLIHDSNDYVAQSSTKFAHPKGHSLGEPWDFSHSAYMEAFGAMSFAFVCHHSSFLVYSSLRRRTAARWNTVTHASIGTAMLLC